MKKKLNNYLLFIFIITLSTGSTLFLITVDSFSLFAFRVVVFIFPLILFFNKSYYKPGHSITDFFLVVLLLFFVHSLISVFWVANQTYALKSVIYFLTIILMYIILVSLARNTENFLKNFIYAWIGGYCINSLVALWEIVTGTHLVSEYSYELFKNHPAHYIHFSPSSLFGNPNHFSIYLVISLLLFTLLRNYIPAVITTILITSAIVFCYFTYSLLATISLVFPLLYLLYSEKDYLLKHIKFSTAFKSLVILFVVLSGIFLFNDFHNPREELIASSGVKALPELQSAGIRKSLFIEGLQLFKDSHGMGIGAGQFQHYIEESESGFAVTSPHSAALEITVEHGLPLVLILLFFWIWFGIKLLRNKKFVFFKIYALFTLVLIFLSNANSSFISSPVSWMMLVLPVVFTNLEEKEFAR